MAIDGTKLLGMGMGLNGKEWESPCMGMGMALIPMGINSRRRMQCLLFSLCNSNVQFIII